MSGAHGVNFLDISDAQVIGLDDQRDLAVLNIPEPYVTRQGRSSSGARPGHLHGRERAWPC